MTGSGRANVHTVAAGAWLLAGCAAALVRALTPFEHGVWLVAYLLLVGFLGQLLLGAGQSRLLEADRSSPAQRRRIAGQAALWNLGVVAVPVGVLAGTRLLIVLGGVALLAALGSFARSVGHVDADRSDRSTALRWAYPCLVGFYACSVVVGVGLGWDNPWI